MMKYVMSFIIILLTWYPAMAADTPEETELIALRMYADWCGKCKTLDPKVDEVKEKFKGKGVLFAVFDQTDEFAQEQSVLHARLLGVEHIQKEFGGMTGVLLLIDPETKQITERITHTASAEEIRNKIQAKLN